MSKVSAGSRSAKGETTKQGAKSEPPGDLKADAPAGTTASRAWISGPGAVPRKGPGSAEKGFRPGPGRGGWTMSPERLATLPSEEILRRTMKAHEKDTSPFEGVPPS